MKTACFVLACVFAVTAGPAFSAEDGKDQIVSSTKIHFNPDAPQILNDYPCVKICGGTQSSCDPKVHRTPDDRCS